MPDRNGHDYQAMHRALVRRMVVISFVPLLVISAANFYLFSRLNRAVVAEQHAHALRYHRESIEEFLESLTTSRLLLGKCHEPDRAKLKACLPARPSPDLRASK